MVHRDRPLQAREDDLPILDAVKDPDVSEFGMYRDTGSSSRNLPVSINISAPTLATGLVIEAMRKIVSGSIRKPASMSR